MRLLFVCFFLLCSSVTLAAAQGSGQGNQPPKPELPEGCDPNDPNTCLTNPAEDYQVPMFCIKGETAIFQIGIKELSSGDFGVGFTLIFADGSVGYDNLNLYFGVGDRSRVTGRSEKEDRLSKMTCNKSTGVCEGGISVGKAEVLLEELGFRDGTVNVEIRKTGGPNRPTICLGKYFDGDDVRKSNSRDKRLLCSFEPAEGADQSLTGNGFFSPNGYGFEHDDDDSASSLFHMTMEGFPSNTLYMACKGNASGVYDEIFRFRSYDETTEDSVIYGILNEELQEEFDKRALFYSYDLDRETRTDEDQQQRALSLSLSKINSSSTSTSASKSIQNGNRRKRKRRNRKKNKRSSTQRSFQARSNVGGKGVGLWLNGDPSHDGIVYVAESCSGDVPTAALGTIKCGGKDQRPGDPRECFNFTRETGVEDGSGVVCDEPGNGFDLLVVKVKDLEAGTYSVCVDGTALSQQITLTGVTIGEDEATHGGIKLSDLQAVVDSTSDIVLSPVGLETISTVSVSSDGCATNLLSADLTEE